MVRSFLEEKAIVHFCSRTAADVEAANDRLAKDFPDCKAIGAAVDVSDEAALASWVKFSAEQSGRIDVVVANVSALNSDDNSKTWHAAFQTDMMGTQVLVEAALPFLEKTKGNIVTISSVSGRDIDFTAPGPYGSMKAALVHYTASLAHVIAPKGMRANTCSPGQCELTSKAKCC